MPTYSLRIFFIILFTWCLCSALSLALGPDGKTINRGTGTADDPYIIPRASSDINIDGLLDEEAWANALVLELKYEITPGENHPALVRTEALLVHNENNFYIAFRAYDPKPEAIRARFRDHDRCTTDDMASVILDTFNDERRGYILSTNPLGSQYDAIKTGSGEDSSWDAIWDSAGRIHDWGWSAEMEIPLSSLRFQRTNGRQVWGFEAWRVYPRTYRYILGTVPLDRNNNCFYCQLSKVEGFEGVSPGRNIEVDPTFTAVRSDERSGLPGGSFEKRDQNAEFGLSAKWGFTPNLTLSGTANPDFSQVEADALQLDINEPFALYYREKRPFFTEGADFFRTRMDVVYTRTMRDPHWGLKLTGKEGRNTIGAYVVRDDLTNLIFPGSRSSSSTSLAIANTSSVFRYKRDIGSRYTLGLLATDREGSNYFNRLLGFDGDFRITDKNRFQVQFIGSSTRYPDPVAEENEQPGDEFGGRAFDFVYNYDARNLNLWFRYRNIDSGFRADLGFIPRVDYIHYSSGWNYTFYAKQGKWWSSFNFGNGLIYNHDQDGELIERLPDFWIGFQGAKQTGIDIYGMVKARERFGGREFSDNFINLYARTRPTKSLYAEINVNIGDRVDYDNTRQGQRLRLDPSISYSLGRHLRLTLDHTFERMTVQDEHLYTANISQGSVIYQFNTKAFFRSILQFLDYDYNAPLYTFDIDPKFKRLFTQLLFSYKINPRTVLFVGYSDNYFGSHEFGLTQADRTFFVKLGYAWVL